MFSLTMFLSSVRGPLQVQKIVYNVNLKFKTKNKYVRRNEVEGRDEKVTEKEKVIE